jgi:microcystin-dependent protein
MILMKRFTMAICILSSVTTSAFAGSFHSRDGYGLIAPNVNGYSTVGNPQYGDIVLDTSTDSFYGYSPAGWTAMSSPPSPVPSGAMTAFAGSSAPSGWLMCNGSAVNRTTYSALFAVIGTTYGSGDGSTTFNLPNTQGVFLRGAGSQVVNSVTYTGEYGTTSSDSLQGHEHTVSTSTTGVSLSPNGDFVYYNHGGFTNSWSIGGGSNVSLEGTISVSDPGHTHTLSDPTSDGTNGTPRVANETRPVNLAINYIIKY